MHVNTLNLIHGLNNLKYLQNLKVEKIQKY